MNKLKERRTKMGLRQIDLAQRANVSLTWIWALENGFQNRISIDVKKRVAEVLGVSIKEIFPNG